MRLAEIVRQAIIESGCIQQFGKKVNIDIRRLDYNVLTELLIQNGWQPKAKLAEELSVEIAFKNLIKYYKQNLKPKRIPFLTSNYTLHPQLEEVLYEELTRLDWKPPFKFKYSIL